ncbi:O-antigen ligase family protein [Rhizomonospora bruguierae]|uniref:O-antigen ligase family protein n=1 Tax=Rhizomonospora bruguierae TaxID=1581705 RepID=UPI001BD0937B|nr:O-antigen ligase family protein [Micromonospora sp. NBRC 107566]
MSSAPSSRTVRGLAGHIAGAVSGSAPRTQAAILLFLALPQVYLLPEGTLDVALTTLVALLLAAGGLVRLARRPWPSLPHTGLFAVLAGLLVVRVLALAWSPDPRAGLQPVVLLGQFIVTLAVMAAALRRKPALLRSIQSFYWPWVIAEACLVVTFRFLPGVEDAFLRSVGGFFAGHNTVVALFGDSPNNVLDPAKAGGVFVNANVAAMFLGVNGLAALAVAGLTRTRWVAATGVVALAAVPFTGSKSATILAVVLPAAALGSYQMSRFTLPAARRYLLVGAVSAGAAGALLLLVVNAALRRAIVEAFVGRTAIWEFGGESFREHPLLGLGYGGWDAGFPDYAAERGLYRSFPPHNVLLAAWSNAGLAGLALSVAFFAVACWLVAGGLSRRAGVDKRFVAFAGAALAWVVVQGMGENTDVFGEIHLIPVLALLIAHLIRPVGEEAKDNAGSAPGRADGRRAETSAVPAVGDLHPGPGGRPAPAPAAVRGEGPGADRAGCRLG